jgi:hypothetical protein
MEQYMKVYVCYVRHGLWPEAEVTKIFDSEDKAKTYCETMLNNLLSESKPEYDDYGLESGTDYIYMEMEVE